MTLPESGPMLSAGFWLHHAALTWRTALDARLRPLDLTHTQFMLLATAGWLQQVSGPPTQQEVADHAGTDRQMTSRVVRTLQERGMLIRTQDPADGRIYRLGLTPHGRAVAGRAIEVAGELDREFFGSRPGPLRTALREVAGLRGTASRTVAAERTEDAAGGPPAR